MAKTASVTKLSATEKRLEAAVFGDETFASRFNDSDSDELVLEDDNASQAADEDDDMAGMEDNQLFMVDDGSALATAHHEDESMDDESSAEAEHADTRKAAWHDSDDERLTISLASVPRLRKLRRTEEEDVVSGLEYARRLRLQFERVYPVPDWALPSRKRRATDDESDSEADTDIQAIALSADPLKALFRSSKSYAKTGKSRVRAPGKLDIKRLRDANHQIPASSAIQCVSFHPSFPLLLTGGYDRTIRVYHIDGKLNTPATSLHLRGVPIEFVECHPDGQRVFIGGKRKFFHIWNLETGAVEKVSRHYSHEGMQSNMIKMSLSRDGEYLALVGASGWVNLLSASTGQWLDAFKVTRGVSDVVWHANGNLTVANIGAELWEYSLESKTIVRRWTDDGGMSTTKIAIGGLNDRWFAVGSKSGIVNIYDRTSDPESSVPKAHRVLKHITTSIHNLVFSSDGQILAIASRAKKDLLKMIHLPSCTVFQNWPTQSTPLGKIGSLIFAPKSEMLAIGNEAGRVTLWSV